jgi:uncharacterized protein
MTVRTEARNGPVSPDDRIGYLDLLRGFAVMAIFIVNIKGMTMPLAFYANPSLWASETDRLIAIAQRFVVEDKWRTIFTALYGAGLVMMADRFAATGRDLGILRRRNLWLVVFGLIHFFLIWSGDILAIYGMIGLLAMIFVQKTPRALFVWGIVLLATGTAWSGGFSYLPMLSPEFAKEVEPFIWNPGPDTLAEQIAAMQGGIPSQIAHRAIEAVGFYLFYFLLGGFWLVTLGLMVMGMALFRSGLLAGSWPLAATVPLAVVGLGGSILLDSYQVMALVRSDYDFAVQSANTWIMLIDGYLGALGYTGLVSVLVSLGIGFGAVRAVGRMAFTNYILCSLIGTSLAGGHLFGLYGEVSLLFLMGVVAATFVGMLIWSPLWLRRFRHGPLEWLWRRLVYGRARTGSDRIVPA